MTHNSHSSSSSVFKLVIHNKPSAIQKQTLSKPQKLKELRAAMGCTHHRTTYTKVRKPCTTRGYYKAAGFRLNSRRFSVHRLRAKFFHLFRLLNRLKSLYLRTIRALMMKRSVVSGNKVVAREINCALYGSYNNGGGEFRYKSSGFATSNSFYAEAIADCLDFIHRNSLSVEEEKPVLVTQSYE